MARISFYSKEDKKAFDRWTHKNYPDIYRYDSLSGVHFYSILGDIIVKAMSPEGWALVDQVLDAASKALGIKLVLEEM